MQYIDAGDMDRLAGAAIVAAEQSSGWATGEQFFCEIEEDKYVVEGAEHSGFVVHHRGTSYDLSFYDGVMAETIVEGPQSWER